LCEYDLLLDVSCDELCNLSLDLLYVVVLKDEALNLFLHFVHGVEDTHVHVFDRVDEHDRSGESAEQLSAIVAIVLWLEIEK
jgi:hypothetical protein